MEIRRNMILKDALSIDIIYSCVIIDILVVYAHKLILAQYKYQPSAQYFK